MVYKYGISSHSLGRAWLHQIIPKLDEAARHGYEGIELVHEDIEYLAKTLRGGHTDANELEAARRIRHMCDERGLEIMLLQPFMHYEGLLDREEHVRRIQKLTLWLQLVQLLRVDLILIPSNFLPADQLTGDRTTIVTDLREVADLGLLESPPVRFAYESLCWGTHINTWEQSWDIVAAVDRPNFGICLDTFNIAGRTWADPSSADGRVPNADVVLHQSLRAMTRTINPEKLFFVQVVDAERLRDPITPTHPFHVDGQPARMSWSRNARLFAFEKPGYLPVVDVLKAITQTGPEGGLGYEGWISAELFSRTMESPLASCPREHARRGKESWDTLVRVMGWEGRVSGKSRPARVAMVVEAVL